MSNETFACLVGLECGRQASLLNGRTQRVGTWNRMGEHLSHSLTASKGGHKTAQVSSVAWTTLGSRLASLQSLGRPWHSAKGYIVLPDTRQCFCGGTGPGRLLAARGSKVTPYLIDKIPGRAANRQGAAASPSDFGTGGMSWQTFSSSEENKKEMMGAPLPFSSRADLLLFNSSKRSRGQEESQVQKRYLGPSCLTPKSYRLTRLPLLPHVLSVEKTALLATNQCQD